MRSSLMSSLILITLFYSSHILGATGCTLNDPDRDVKRLFPKSTGYKTDFIMYKEHGGEALVKEVEEKLGGKLDPSYESIDVSFAYYTVLKGKETIGRIHGLNQKGVFGGLQLILATDLDGKILDFFYQRISSPDAKKFKNKDFTKQFAGLTLADFYVHRFKKGSDGDKIGKIESPSKEQVEDFKNTIRGLMKNLIQLDVFHLNRKNDGVYKKLKGGK